MATIHELLSVLHDQTGRRLDAQTFDSRVRIQKVVYLAQALGIDLDREYRFNNYFHGPYSPGLAREYYGEDRNPSVNIREGAALPDAGGALEVLASALARDADTEFLETVATIHSVAVGNKSAENTQILQVVRDLKPHLGDELLEAGCRWLTRNGLIELST